MPLVPEKAINYTVWLDGVELLGSADIELPSIEMMTSEVKGAGVAGSINTPVLGHPSDIKLTLNWRSAHDSVFKLSRQQAIDLTCYQALQDFNTNSGEYEVEQLRMYVKGIPVNTNLGKLSVGEVADTQTELTLIYILVELNGKTLLKFDRYNFIFEVDGVDYLADVRSALGKN